MTLQACQNSSTQKEKQICLSSRLLLPVLQAGRLARSGMAFLQSRGCPLRALQLMTPDGPPIKKNPLPYVISIVSALVVAATMYYAFNMLDIVTIGKGFTSGLGIGACFAAPWLATNYGFAGRPFKLTLIDGGYATFGSAVIGAVIASF